MRIMYDSVTARDIPSSVGMVAGYVNGKYAWSQADWDRFPNAVKVRIATRGNVTDGHVLDVEVGAAQPYQAPGWAVQRRSVGVDPTVYCSLASWDMVRAAFRRATVPEPHYWIAHYDNVRDIPSGAVAKQFINPPKSGGHFDLSMVADYWPGIDPVPNGDDNVDYKHDLVTSWATDGQGNRVQLTLEQCWTGALGHAADANHKADLALAAMNDFRAKNQAQIEAVTALLLRLVGAGVTLVPSGEITVQAVNPQVQGVPPTSGPTVTNQVP